MSIDQLGSRLLHGLFQSEPQPILLGLDHGVARVMTPDGVMVALCEWDRVHSIVEQHKSGLLHVVLVGGDHNERQGLEKQWPTWQMGRQFSFHHVDENGGYHKLKGPKLPALEKVAQRCASLDPLGPDEARALLEASREAVQASENFAARRRLPWATIGIAAVCVFAFAMQELWGGSKNIFGLLKMGANPGHAAFHEPWTLLSSAFLHIGYEHILLNMLALFSFGPLLEKAMGAPRYLLLYVGSALGGSLLSAAGHEQLVSAGASGALWGLMVGGAVLITRPQGLLPPLLVAQAKKRVWQPVLFNGIYSMQPGIDWLCHLGGGLVGGALVLSGIVLIGLRNEKSPSLRLRALTAAAAALCIASLGVAWAKGKPWELNGPPAMERQFTGFGGLSLEVPVGLAEHRETGFVVYGGLDKDPVAVEARAGVSDDPLSPEQIANQQKEIRESLKHPEGATLVGQLTPTKIGAIDAEEAHAKYSNGVTTRTWFWVVPEGAFVIRIYQNPSLPSAWQGVSEAVLRSVRTSGGHVN